MSRRKLRFVPFVLATVLALAHVALIERAALHHTGGQLSYPIDDAFIHLALAKHLVFDGVYGVTKYGFTASSSSIVWPFLLAGVMRVVGDGVAIPLALNVIAAVALVAVCARALDRAPGLDATSRTAALLAIVILVPVATLVAIGMEHVLHAALTMAFVVLAGDVIADDEGPSRARVWRLAVLAAALTATRYEGIFPVGLAVVALAARRRLASAAILAACGAAPVVLFGAWSIAHGGLFLPNSIALKRQHLSFASPSDLADLLGGNVLDRISREPYLLPLVFAAVALFVRAVRRDGPWSRDAVRCGIAFLTTVAHVELASLGWFYRYEAYLVALDVTVVAMALGSAPSDEPVLSRARRAPVVAVASALGAIVALAPLGRRAIEAQAATPLACRNIFQQQVQTARFLAREFPNDVAAINDIGAVAYYRDAPIVDLVGLAQLDVARAKSLQLDKPLTAAQMAEFAKPAPVAVIYDEWFPYVPTSWVRLGRLRIDANRACAYNDVAIYATSGEQVPRVLAALRDFAPSLPAGVRREGRFVETPPPPLDAWRADAGDILYVDVAGAPDLSSVGFVGEDGSMYLGKIGEVKVRGMTLDEITAATAAKMRDPAEPIPADARPAVRLLEERRCRVRVAGNVYRVIDEPFECGVGLDKPLGRAGVRLADAIDPYVWREENGALRRIDFNYDARDASAARGIPLRGGDVVIVP
jgi:hypothetical protein